MATKHSSWLNDFSVPPKNKGSSTDEELLVFGYSCKLFRDDERAIFIDQGKHLIPWMGDEAMKIDRYDVRGYLNDLQQYEVTGPHNFWDHLSADEKRIEELCEEERYTALYNDMSEEDIYHEEELKRLKAALAEDDSYHEMGYNYNQEADTSENETTDDVAFALPEGLQVPLGLTLPDTMKLHAIIEKTASFVSQHGAQMEIVIKTKQVNNPQFQFLAFDSPLNTYYKHLVTSIKAGKYKPAPTPIQTRSDSEDDDDYLHPSLFAQNTSRVKIPDLEIFRGSQNDAYSKLVENLKDKVVPSVPAGGFADMSSAYCGTSHSLQGGWIYPQNALGLQAYSQPPPPGDEALYQAFSSTLGPDVQMKMPQIPPSEIQSIVDKMAEYVARSGDDFEIVVRRKKDKRFEFLDVENPFHGYYQQKKASYLEERRKEMEEQIQKQRAEADKRAAIGPVSFSLKMKEQGEEKKINCLEMQLERKVETPQSLIQSTAANLQALVAKITERKNLPEVSDAKLAEDKIKDRLAAAAREKMVQQTRERLLQQERKRKATIFLSMLKKASSALPKAGEDNYLVPKNKAVFGPHLEVSPANVPASQKSSPKRDHGFESDSRSSYRHDSHSSSKAYHRSHSIIRGHRSHREIDSHRRYSYRRSSSDMKRRRSRSRSSSPRKYRSQSRSNSRSRSRSRSRERSSRR